MISLKLNKFLTLRLENNQTLIYVNDEHFIQCMYLLLNIPKNKVQDFEEINSIDEASEILDKSLERGINNSIYNVSPKEEFMGHCSNLQVWVESGYDSRLLHRNLAFPLLKKLSEAGDKLAKVKFKEEIILRFNSGYPTVVKFLQKGGYLNELTEDEALLLKIERCIKCSSIKIYENEFSITKTLLDSLWMDEKRFFFQRLNLKQETRNISLKICKSCFIETFLAFNHKLYNHLDLKYDDFIKRIEKKILSKNSNSFSEFGIYYLGHNIIKHYLYDKSLKPLFNQILIKPDIFMNLISNVYAGDKEVPLINFREKIEPQNIDYILYLSDRIFIISLYLLDLASEIIDSKEGSSPRIQNDSIVEEFDILSEDLEYVRRTVPNVSLLEKIVNNEIIHEFDFLFHFTKKLSKYISNFPSTLRTGINIPIEDLDYKPMLYGELRHFCFVVKRLKQLFLMLSERL